MCGFLEEGILSRRIGRCKGFEVEMVLVCVSNSEEVRCGWFRGKGRETGKKWGESMVRG